MPSQYPQYPQFRQQQQQMPQMESSGGGFGSLLWGGLAAVAAYVGGKVFGDKLVEWMPFLKKPFEFMGFVEKKPAATVTPPAPTPTPAAAAAVTPPASAASAVAPAASAEPAPVVAKPPAPVEAGASEPVIPPKPTAPVRDDKGLGKGEEIVDNAGGGGAASEPKRYASWPSLRIPTFNNSYVNAAKQSVGKYQVENSGVMPTNMSGFSGITKENPLAKAVKNQGKTFDNLTITDARGILQQNSKAIPPAIVARLEYLLSDGHLTAVNATANMKITNLAPNGGMNYLSKFFGGRERLTPGIEGFITSLTSDEFKKMSVGDLQKFGTTPLQAQVIKDYVDQVMPAELNKNKSVVKKARGMSLSASPQVSLTGIFNGLALYKDITPLMTPAQIMQMVDAAANGGEDITQQLPLVEKGRISDTTMKDKKDLITKAYSGLPEEIRNIPLDVIIRTERTHMLSPFTEALRGKASSARKTSALTLPGVIGGEDLAAIVPQRLPDGRSVGSEMDRMG